MKRVLLTILSVFLVCLLSYNVAKAYSKKFTLQLDNGTKYTTESANISVGYSDSLEHSIVMYGTDKTSVNYIQIILQRKGLIFWGNSAYTIYTTTQINQPMTAKFGVFKNGNFRIVFDSYSHPYQGIYYGDVEHFAV